MNVVETLSLLKNKKIKPSDIFEYSLSNYDKWESKVHAWADYDAERIYSHYKDLDTRLIDWDKNPLYSLSIGAKDCYNTEDFYTRRGSVIYKDFEAGNDARVIRKIKDEGAVVIGKTATAEFSIHEPSDTRNPFDLERSPGTSSGGSAVAVATGMAQICFGTQTAASTSKPCSFCGVYGFKPSFGFLPRTGVLKTSDTLDTLTLIGRSVHDLELVFDQIKLRGLDYPIINSYEKVYAPNETIKIGLLVDTTDIKSLEYVKESILKLGNEIAGVKRFEVTELKAPKFLDAVHDAHRKIYNKSVSYYFSHESKHYYDKLSPSMRTMIEDGKLISKNEYSALLSLQDMHIKQAHEEVFKDFDFIISPSTNGVAPIGSSDHTLKDFSLIWTYLGVPLVACPKFVHKGLPFGFQVCSKKYTDKNLFHFIKDLHKYGIIQDVSIL